MPDHAPDVAHDPLATEGTAEGGSAPAFPPDVLALALLRLRAEGNHEAADSLAGAHQGDVTKACGGMGSAVGSAGGFLIPPQTGTKRKRKGNRNLVRVSRKYVARVLKALEE